MKNPRQGETIKLKELSFLGLWIEVSKFLEFLSCSPFNDK
jgi:hypothetical protein